MYQHAPTGWTMKTFPKVEEASHKRSHVVRVFIRDVQNRKVYRDRKQMGSRVEVGAAEE